MKLFTGCMVSAGLILAAATANAQLLKASGSGGARYTSVSDFDGPYAELPPQAPAPYYRPALLPPQEVFAVLRANGFQPLGMLRQRGAVYMIAAIAPDGEDGRVIIDGRTGQIIRFVPAFSMGGSFDGPTVPAPYGATRSMEPVPPLSTVRGGPRPPAPIPYVASRSVPLPKASPPRAAEVPKVTVREGSSEVPKLAAKPPSDKPASEPAQKPVPTETQTASAAQTTASINQAKPVQPAILPTQQMPAAQGLE